MFDFHNAKGKNQNENHKPYRWIISVKMELAYKSFQVLGRD